MIYTHILGLHLVLMKKSSQTKPTNIWSYFFENKIKYSRRKFRSQTSDNMDRWKAEMGREEEGYQKRESLRRKKIQVREKVGKSRNILFFQWFAAPGGRKVGSLKQRVRSHVVRWEMKSCTPLWREAHLQVTKLKTRHVRSTFRSCDVEKVHAVVAPSTCRSQNVQSTHPWSTFGSWDLQKVYAVVAQSTCRSQNVQKHHMFALLLDVQMSFCVAGARDCAPVQKWAKREGFVAVSKTMTGVGHLKRIWKDAFRVAGAVQETCSSLGGQGADFLRGVAFWRIRSVGLPRWFCVTGAALRMTYDLAPLFRGRRSTLHRWSGKIAKRIGTRPSALHSTFHFWRRPRRFASFLMLSTSKIEEVSQNCFVFDVVKFKNWGRLSELLRFWRCQVETLRKSRSSLHIDR